MRRDVRKLLEKLNRQEFRYREFEDPFSETELWPIFEAVLADRRIVGDEVATLPQRRMAQAPEAPAPAVRASYPMAQTRQPARAQADLKAIFSGYGSIPGTASPPKENMDLQDFFNRFAEKD